MLRLFQKGLARISDFATQKFRLWKWRRNADPRLLNWNWEDTNFNRIAVVNVLLYKFKDPRYLEIGCASNILFNSVPVLKKIGVDPFVGGNVRKTSDEFFATNQERFELIFIDGLHTYDQVRRDVVNALKVTDVGGVIVLHDMLPSNWVEHHVPILTRGVWTGDVWKIAFELCNTAGIDFKILRVDHGVGVVKVLQSEVKLIDLREDLIDMQFSYYCDNLIKLPIISWSDSQEWLKN